MAVADVPFDIPVGYTKTIRFVCLDGAGNVVTDGWAGSTLIFRATRLNGAEILRREVPHDGTTATLALTTEETRLFSLGRLAKYEFERRIEDEQLPICAGVLTGKLGGNDD